MKKKLSLFMAAVMLLTTPASVSLASDAGEAIIVEDDAVLSAEDEVDTESTAEDETEDVHEEENFIMSVEEAKDPSDEPAAVSTESAGSCGDNLTWEWNAGTLTISGTGEMTDWETGKDTPWYDDYVDSITEIVIKNGVTSIGNYAFYWCTSLEKVSIPDSVTSIGDSAFLYCKSLTNVDIPDSVVTIGDSAFNACYSLTEIIIPDSVYSIGESAFYNCSKMVSVDIPNSVTSIGASAFSHCNKLEQVIIPDSITTIEASTFSFCTSLTYVYIPASVTAIEGSAFYACTKLTEVNIPNSVNTIGAAFGYTGLISVVIPASVTSLSSTAFSQCYSLASISVETDNQTYSSIDGVLFNKEKTELICCPCGKSGSYEIPESVTAISTGAFSYCENLTEIIIPDSVIRIEGSAFYQCDGLTEMVIPDSVTRIGTALFSQCSNLVSVSFPNNVYVNSTDLMTHFQSGSMFNGCTSLTTVVLPDSIQQIGERMFYGCASLVSITIPSNVTSISDYAFYGCDSLKYAYYPGTEDDLTIGTNNTALINALQCGLIAIVVAKYDESTNAYTSEYEELLVGDEVSFSLEVTIPATTEIQEFNESNWFCTNSDGKDCDAITIEAVSVPGSYYADDENYYKTYIVSAIGALNKGGTYTITFQSPTGAVAAVDVVISGEESTVYIFFGASLSSNVEYCIVGDTIVLDGQIRSEDEDADIDEVIDSVTWTMDDSSLAEIVSIESDGPDLIWSENTRWLLTVHALKAGIVTITGTAKDGTTTSYTLYIDPEMIISVPEAVYSSNYVGKNSQQITCSVTLSEPDAEYLEWYMSGLSYDFSYKAKNKIVNHLEVQNEFYQISDDGLKATYTLEVFSKQVNPSLTFTQRENYAVITFISASGKEDSTTTKAIVVYDGFATSQDGWVIANASYSFGYSDGYKLDFAKFYTNGIATFETEVVSIFARKWGGSCFGLSLLAAAQYNGQIDLTSYFSADESEDKLNAFGYDDITQLSEGLVYTVDGNTNIIDSIERVQCSQFSVEIRKAEVFKDDNDYSELLSYLSEENCKPIVVCVTGAYSHAVVIETLTKPVDLGNGIYKIYLYDSNSPITYADIDGLTSKYSHSQSYLTLNTITGEWEYYYNGSLGTSNSYREILSVSPTIRFFDPSKLSSSYFYGDYSLDTENVTNVYYSSSMDIEDMEGNSVFKIDDGKTYLYNENGYYLPYSESSDDTSEEQKGYVLLPAGNYTFKTSGDTGIVRFCENQYIVAYETSGNVSATFDDNAQLVVIENTDSENSADFTVVIQDMSGTAVATAEGSLESNTALEIQLITNTDGTVAAIASTTSDPEEISTTLTVDGSINDTNFHINRKNITSCIIALSHSSYTFDGTAKKPSITVTDGTTTLVEGADYTVSYSNNVYVGTATVTVTGIGNYTGTVSTTFLITSANNGSGSSSGGSTVKDGLTLDSDGIYRYYQSGVFAETFAGVVEYDGGYFFVANGLLCSNAHGLNLYGDTWYFLAYGQVQTQYTGFTLYDNEWFYITEGVLDTNVNGLMTYDGEQFLFAEGRLLLEYNGLWLNSSTISGDNQWYFIAAGMVQNVSQVAMYDGEWFVVKNGILDTSYNGTIEYDGATFNVVNGQLYS